MAAADNPDDARDEARAGEWIRHQIGPTRRELLLAWLPWVAAAVVVGVLAWVFVRPAPPERVVIAAGPKDGAYYAFAQQYAKTFADSKVTLDVRETAGTVENYKLLESGEASLAIVQGGVASPASPEQESGASTRAAAAGGGGGGEDDEKGDDKSSGRIHAIAGLYYEPVWLFIRGAPSDELFKFDGRTVAAGPEGSGTREIARRLLTANGVIGRIALSPLGGRAAADALLKGEVDVAVFVLSPEAPLVVELLGNPSVRPLNFDRAEAYVRRYRYLSRVSLPRGAIDMAGDLPRQDVQLVAPAANLVCRADLHPAIIPLAARAAELAHEGGDLLAEPKEFPSAKHIEWPLDPAAREYFESGPPLLQKYLPFWVAALVDRMKYLLLPLITLALPLMRVAPPLYVWRVRSRIYRWYRILQELDRRSGEPARAAAVAAGDPTVADDVSHDLAVLRVLERELTSRKVPPLSYMQEFYNLRLHVDLLRRRLEQQRAAISTATTTHGDSPSVTTSAAAPGGL